MHPLVAAIRKLDGDSRLDIDRFLLLNGMYIRNESSELKKLKERGRNQKGVDGTKVFLLMERMKRSSRKFRKLVRELMKHHPLGNRAPADDPSWELAAYSLLIRARKKPKKKVLTEIRSW